MLLEALNYVIVAVCLAGFYLQVAGKSTFRKCYTVDDKEHCFVTSLGSTKTWEAARVYCENLAGGQYALVAVDDVQVQNALAHFMDLSDFVSKFVWTGITHDVQGKWYWIDGTAYRGKQPAIHTQQILPIAINFLSATLSLIVAE